MSNCLDGPVPTSTMLPNESGGNAFGRRLAPDEPFRTPHVAFIAAFADEQRVCAHAPETLGEAKELAGH